MPAVIFDNCCTCSCFNCEARHFCDTGTELARVTLGDVTLFTLSQDFGTFPAGDYVVRYCGGAWCDDTASQHFAVTSTIIQQVNWHEGHRVFVTYVDANYPSDPNQEAYFNEPISDGIATAALAQTRACNVGAAFHHAGGAIRLKFTDNPNYANNANGSPNPSFVLYRTTLAFTADRCQATGGIPGFPEIRVGSFTIKNACQYGMHLRPALQSYDGLTPYSGTVEPEFYIASETHSFGIWFRVAPATRSVFTALLYFKSRSLNPVHGLFFTFAPLFLKVGATSFELDALPEQLPPNPPPIEFYRGRFTIRNDGNSDAFGVTGALTCRVSGAVVLTMAITPGNMGIGVSWSVDVDIPAGSVSPGDIVDVTMTVGTPADPPFPPITWICTVPDT